jgi:tetratricopeptide (TPR) repeat protein
LPRIHPKLGLLEGLTGALPEARRRILLHLRVCPACRARQEPRREDRVLPWRPRDSDYDEVVDRALRAFRTRLAAAERERQAAPARLAELLALPPGRRQMLLCNSRGFQSLGLCQLCLRRSREETPGDPRRGEELASLAVQISERIDPPRVDAGRVEDLRAQGWMLLANARRVRSDLRGAEEAFLCAETHRRRGSGDRLDRADLLVFKACLRRAQRRFVEAARLLRRALSIWLATGEDRRAAETLTSWALVCKEDGETDEAVLLLDRAAVLAGPNPEPRFRLILQHNLATCLIDKGCLLEAQAILCGSRGLYHTLRNPILDLRLSWLHATITHGLGRLTEAVDLLTATRDGFLEQGNGYVASLLSVELAQVHAEMGCFADAEESARTALEVFRSLGVEREALAALALLHQAVARQPAVSRAS